MSVYDNKGTLLGFTYDNTHSSTLGIVRVSNGSEFTMDLLPSFEDKKVNAVGVDGQYYYGSDYSERQFNIDFAFDGLTDSQLRSIKTLFGDKNLHYLTFDETPYKSYKVKISAAPQMNYHIMSDNYTLMTDFSFKGGNQYRADDRYYCGTGTLSFIAYEPFTVSRIINGTKFKYRDQFENSILIPEWTDNGVINYNRYNYNEWKDSVALLNSSGLDTFNRGTSSVAGSFTVYNPGDLDAPFNLDFHFVGNQSHTIDGTFGIQIGTNLTLSATGGFTVDSSDDGFRINSKLRLIEGIDANGATTGRLYNRVITNGDFFDIPTSANTQILTIVMPWTTRELITATIDYGYKFY